MVHLWPKRLTVTNAMPLTARGVKTMLFLWNCTLALYSVVSTYALTPHVVGRLYHHGYEESVCIRNHDTSFTVLPYGRWMLIFIISKVVELGDTFFLVLRNKPVNFLHWYHHMATLLYAYVSGIMIIKTAEWIVWMNLLVHSYMYTYYALAVYWPQLVRPFSTLITSIQIAQMFHGMYLTGYNVAYCDGVKDYAGFTMYSIYAFLFISYFVKRYIPTRSVHVRLE